MADHSPTPWASSDREKELDVSAHPHIEVWDSRDYGVFHVTVGSTSKADQKRARANVRRIIACVNFLEGISTSALTTKIGTDQLELLIARDLFRGDTVSAYALIDKMLESRNEKQFIRGDIVRFEPIDLKTPWSHLKGIEWIVRTVDNDKEMAECVIINVLAGKDCPSVMNFPLFTLVKIGHYGGNAKLGD